jgi:hypothetical protein
MVYLFRLPEWYGRQGPHGPTSYGRDARLRADAGDLCLILPGFGLQHLLCRLALSPASQMGPSLPNRHRGGLVCLHIDHRLSRRRRVVKTGVRSVPIYRLQSAQNPQTTCSGHGES